MIQGYFNPAGRPYVEAYIIIPGLQPPGDPIPLLLDTVADNTLIQPADARIMGINTRDLAPADTIRGIGGFMSYAKLPAFVTFQERTRFWPKPRLVYFQTELAIAIGSQGNRNLPSLLGRDIIDDCRLLYDRQRRQIELKPHSTNGMISRGINIITG